MLHIDKEVPSYFKITVTDEFYEIANKIKQIIANYFGVDYEWYSKKTRKKEVVEIKHWSMYYIYHHYNISEVNLTKLFGLKNHTSFTSAKRKIDGWLSTNNPVEKQFWSDINYLVGVDGSITAYNDKNYSKRTMMQNSKVIISVKKFDILLENTEKGIIFVGYSDEDVEAFRKQLGISIKNQFLYENDDLYLDFKSSKEKTTRTAVNLKLKSKK